MAIRPYFIFIFYGSPFHSTPLFCIAIIFFWGLIIFIFVILSERKVKGKSGEGEKGKAPILKKVSGPLYSKDICKA